LQNLVVLSTMEAEYVVATEACKELIWLKDFMKELGKEQVTPSLNSDSQSPIDLANNPVYHDRTKHIIVQHHFIHILLKNGVLSPAKIRTSQNPTDMLTKMAMTEKLKPCSVSWVFWGEDSELSRNKCHYELRVRKKKETEYRCYDNNQSPSKKLLSCGARLLP